MLRQPRVPHFKPALSAALALAAPIFLAAPQAAAQQSVESAAGAPASTGPVLREFPPDQEVCYGRIYGREHLAAHPRQKVTEIYLARLLSQDPQSELPPKTREQIAADNVEAEHESQKALPAFPQGAGRTHLEVYVQFKDKPGMFLGDVECRREGSGFTCGVECDGGSFTAKLEGKTLILKQNGLRVQSGCTSGDESAPEVTINPDDDAREFHLQPPPIAACERARSAYRPHWIAAGESLRQRFASSPTICYRRTYDDAHLRAHPQQLVKSVMLQRLPASPEAEHQFRVRFQLRDGTVADKTVQCSEAAYSFHCAADSGSFKLTRGAGKTVTLREAYYEEGTIAELLGLKKVEDDHSFRLEQADPAECR